MMGKYLCGSSSNLLLYLYDNLIRFHETESHLRCFIIDTLNVCIRFDVKRTKVNPEFSFPRKSVCEITSRRKIFALFSYENLCEYFVSGHISEVARFAYIIRFFYVRFFRRIAFRIFDFKFV